MAAIIARIEIAEDNGAIWAVWAGIQQDANDMLNNSRGYSDAELDILENIVARAVAGRRARAAVAARG